MIIYETVIWRKRVTDKRKRGEFMNLKGVYEIFYPGGGANRKNQFGT